MMRTLKTEADYKEALAKIDRVFDAKLNTSEADRLDILALLVEAYEEQHHPGPGCGAGILHGQPWPHPPRLRALSWQPGAGRRSAEPQARPLHRNDPPPASRLRHLRRRSYSAIHAC